MDKRKQVTSVLAHAATMYLIDRRYSAHIEFGVKDNRRLDIIALNTKGHLIGIEVKSCIADFKTDKKWRDYLPFVNQLYFIFDEATWNKHSKVLKESIGKDAGIMITHTVGESFIRVKIVQAVKNRETSKDNLFKLAIKMAWRSGESLAKYPRRVSKRIKCSDPLADKRIVRHRIVQDGWKSSSRVCLKR